MIKYFLAISLCIAACCNMFPSSLDRIESSEYRLLDMVYEPADAAPGDTVRVKAIFAGKVITASDLDLSVSYNVVTSMYGTDTALDIQKLGVSPIETTFTDRTTCFVFSVPIPQNILQTSKQIPDNWQETVPQAFREFVPSEISKMSKSEMLATVSTIANASPEAIQMLTASQPDLIAALPAICQMLTVEMRLFAHIKNDYTIQSDYSVRYNSKFSKIPNCKIFSNTNPAIDSIGIYKVPGTTSSFDSTKSGIEFTRLDCIDSSKTILIEKDFTYFVRVFTNPPETTQTIDNVVADSSCLEQLSCFWFYQQNDENDEVGFQKYMGIENSGKLIEKIIPAADSRIDECTLWPQVSDYKTNELFRPTGSSIKEARVKFEYTNEYLDQFKKKSLF